MNYTQLEQPQIEEIIANTVSRILQSVQQDRSVNEWMPLKEAAKYAGVSYNTLMKFRLMGLKISEIDGVKRVSKTEVNRFMEENCF